MYFLNLFRIDRISSGLIRVIVEADIHLSSVKLSLDIWIIKKIKKNDDIVLIKII